VIAAFRGVCGYSRYFIDYKIQVISLTSLILYFVTFQLVMIYNASLLRTKYIYSISSIINNVVEKQNNFSIYTFYHMFQLI